MKKIRKNDNVIVIAGKDKGKTGKVLSVQDERIVVEGIAVVQRTQKASQQNPNGGFFSKELSIHISNVAMLSPKTGKATKVRIEKNEKGKNQRVAVKCGSILPS